MSSVPVQFLILVQEIAVPPGVTAPTFVGTTPVDGSCITVASTYTQQITARSGGDAAMYVSMKHAWQPCPCNGVNYILYHHLV